MERSQPGQRGSCNRRPAHGRPTPRRSPATSSTPFLRISSACSTCRLPRRALASGMELEPNGRSPSGVGRAVCAQAVPPDDRKTALDYGRSKEPRDARSRSLEWPSIGGELVSLGRQTRETHRRGVVACGSNRLRYGYHGGGARSLRNRGGGAMGLVVFVRFFAVRPPAVDERVQSLSFGRCADSIQARGRNAIESVGSRERSRSNLLPAPELSLSAALVCLLQLMSGHRDPFAAAVTRDPRRGPQLWRGAPPDARTKSGADP